MNIDQKIKRELEKETPDLDLILVDDEGLFERLTGSFKGAMRGWVITIQLSAVFVGIACVWTGYRFFIAAELQQQIFWGVWFVASLITQTSIKQFLITESNRSSIMREIKRAEIAIARLSEKIEA